MDVLLPRSLDEALAMKAARPSAVPIAGGTDLMVEVNFGRLRPEAFLDVSRLSELQQIRREDGRLFLGAGVTYDRIEHSLIDFPPLVQASRSVGSPQIRRRATVGGNLGTASPAGDALPVLAAYQAEIVVGRAGGATRSLPWGEFLLGVKRTALEPAELILGMRWPVLRGPGSFSKIGSRNAMVIAVAGLCLVIDEDAHAVRVALGSVAPTVVRAPAAEAFAARALSDSGAWQDPAASLPDQAAREFGELVQAAAAPIDDVRGAAAYRRHTCGVMARRALLWALDDRRTAIASEVIGC
jgi:CO/xanthine dehydrogenase FAD-binding subunit